MEQPSDRVSIVRATSSLTARLRRSSLENGTGEIRFLPRGVNPHSGADVDPRVYIRIRAITKQFIPTIIHGLVAELLVQRTPDTSSLVPGTIFYLGPQPGGFHYYRFYPSQIKGLEGICFVGAERRSNILTLSLKPPGAVFTFSNAFAPLEALPVSAARPTRRRRHCAGRR